MDALFGSLLGRILVFRLLAFTAQTFILKSKNDNMVARSKVGKIFGGKFASGTFVS